MASGPEQRPAQLNPLANDEAAASSRSVGEWLDHIFNGDPEDVAVSILQREAVAVSVAMSSLVLLEAGISPRLAAVPLVVGSTEMGRNFIRSLVHFAKS